MASHGAEGTEEWVSRELPEEQAVELGSAVAARVSIALGREHTSLGCLCVTFPLLLL